MRRLFALVLLLPVLALSACSGLGGTNGHNYIAGNGEVQTIPVKDRGNPLELTGTTLAGQHFDLAGTRGKVTVLNVWGSWCGDCIAEAGELQKAHQQLGPSVPFVGIDVRETSPDQARAYVSNFGITYPSIYNPDGTSTLAFSSYVSPRTIPATLVLDRTGRPVVIIRGTVPDALALVETVRCVQDPKRPHCEGY